MKYLIIPALVVSLPLVNAAKAEENHRRQLDSHVHGESVLNIAIEGKVVEIALEAPGADIVGFEHPPHDADDHAAIDAAIAQLRDPGNVVALPTDAGCELENAEVELLGEAGENGDHGHDDHHDHDDEHDDDHKQHEDDHDGDHEGKAGDSHTEFHAEYRFGCADPDQIRRMEFTFFASFEHSRELAVQIVTRQGAFATDASRDTPDIDLPDRN